MPLAAEDPGTALAGGDAEPSPPGVRLALPLAALTAILYVLAAALGLAFIAPGTGIAAVWPAAGLAAGLLAVFYGARVWLVASVLLATVAVNVFHGQGIAAAVVFGVVNAGEAWLVAALVRRRRSSLRFESLRDVGEFVALALGCTLLAGLAGASTLYALEHSQDWRTAVLVWALADFVGILTVAPLVVVWHRTGWRGFALRELAEFALLLLGLLFLTAFAFRIGASTGSWDEIVVVALLVIVTGVMAVRLPLRLALGAPLAASLVGAWQAASANGPYPMTVLGLDDRVLAIQTLSLVLGLVVLCLAALIHQRLLAEQTLREADRRKDEFLAVLAHELRNPLAPIRQAARIAQTGAASEAQLRWSCEVIERQVRHMALLLDDLLDVSRISRGKLELRKSVFDLREAVEAALETARPLIEARRHTLHVDLGTDALHVEADPLRLAQILANLLTNAAKYTEPGGSIHLSAGIEGDALRIRVRDTGIGISPEMLPRLFRMFSQAHSALERSEGGLGIGLALVKGLVELHGGSVAAASGGAGCGSEFSVRLPVGNAPARTDAPPQRTAAPGAVRPAHRVLLADDNRDAAESLGLLLELEGQQVRLAGDGREALAVAATFRPEVVLLDIGMPELDGYETAMRLRAQPGGAGLLLIAVSGWGQPDDKRRAAEAGFDAHLTKPIDPGALLRLIEERLGQEGAASPQRHTA